MVPDYFWIVVYSCDKEVTDVHKRKKTTKYLIGCFESLKVIKHVKILSSLSYNYKKINKKC